MVFLNVPHYTTMIEKKYRIEGYSDYQTEGKDLIVWGQSVTDEHHTMEELYMHRYHLYLALVKVLDTYVTPLSTNIMCWKSKLHDDGTMFEDSFILGMTVDKPSFIEGGDGESYYITYHLPMKYWNFINVITLEKAPPYDGHTSAQILERLLKL